MTTFLEVVGDMLYEIFVYQYPKTILVMFILWIVYLCTKIECLVDFGWCVNHLVVGASLCIQYYSTVNTRGWLSLLILVLWFLRLGGFIFITRILTGFTDKRYEGLAAGKNQPVFYFIQYQFQAFLVILTALPLYFVFRLYDQDNGGLLQWNFIVFAILSLFGYLLEFKSDVLQTWYVYSPKHKDDPRK